MVTCACVSPEMVHDLQVSRQFYKISRNVGTKYGLGVNPLGFSV